MAVAVYGAGTLDNLLSCRADRLDVMFRQLPRVMETLYGLKSASSDLESEGRSLIEKVKKRLGR